MENTRNEQVKKEAYFAHRQVEEMDYAGYRLPRYLRPYFSEQDKDLSVLDIGCGFGQLLRHLQQKGFTRITGIDINREALEVCRKNGLSVQEVEDIRRFAPGERFDRIVMSHVLEHLPKEDIIDTLAYIREQLLSENGLFLLMVPNAQSPTGTYWRYEDFTHTLLFTAGSCQYVLKAAGFTRIDFIDPDGTAHLHPVKKILIRTLLGWYRFREKIWHRVLQTSYHRHSPRIYSFDIKIAAR